MIKKSIYTLLLGILLILGACNDTMNDDDEVAESEDANTEETSTDQTKKESEVEEEPSVTEENDDNKPDQENIEEEPVQKITEPLYKIDDNWSVVPIEEGTDENVVLITIDDAPEKYALEMAQTLKELEAPAIFFVNGHFLETDEKKEQLRQIHEMGFAIGNHTYTHPNLSDIDESEQKEEILSLNDLIEDVVGERPKFFRAPFGVNTDFSKELVKSEGMLLMNWSFGYDWEKDYQSADALADKMVNTEYLTDGANLLMHDREWTAAALEDIVKGLRDKGYEFVDPMTLQVPE
ncbi:polysaccharide deacetylase family protein [Gracilibacillus sp. D59]|uniref:polysaccharide deacetylase family protein n=1 Tax=Gracilibacillus sp. D59 TaxID=3457434 RepID=UPI003FCEB92B